MRTRYALLAVAATLLVSAHLFAQQGPGPGPVLDPKLVQMHSLRSAFLLLPWPAVALAGYAGTALGPAGPGASLVVNTNLLASGLLGLAVALPAGNTFVPGTQEVARIILRPRC